MTKLIEFYFGYGLDNSGRTIDEILDMNISEWEGCHDFIQWIFPLLEPSKYNKNAPLLTSDDLQKFRHNNELRLQVRLCWRKFLEFLGLGQNDKGIYELSFSSQRFLGPFNHNHLRITRVLKFMTLIGFRKDAMQLLDFLKIRTIPVGCFTFWENAVNLDKGI